MTNKDIMTDLWVTLKKGEIYTINSVNSFGDVLLEEIKTPSTGHYYGDRFKPINPTKSE